MELMYSYMVGNQACIKAYTRISNHNCLSLCAYNYYFDSLLDTVIKIKTYAEAFGLKPIKIKSMYVFKTIN